jgi:hypothetical protein
MEDPQVRAYLSYLWLRFLEWRFARFHEHQFLPTGESVVIGGDKIERLACSKCPTVTWS